MQADRVEQSTEPQINETEHHRKDNKKGSKKSKYVPVDEQVVFGMIDSINLYSNSIKKNKLGSQTNNKLEELKEQTIDKVVGSQNSGIKRIQIVEVLSNKIKGIPFSGINDIRMKLRSSLRKVYLGKKVEGQLQCKGNVGQNTLRLIRQSINGYLALQQLLRECSVPTPIQEGFYDEYSQIWQQLVEKLEKQESNQQQLIIIKTNIKEMILSIWQQIPHLSLNKHLNSFDLKLSFASIQQQIIIRILASLLVDNKIQQCCTYYEVYLNARNQSHLNKPVTKEQRQFQDLVLIPKITKSDHIFSTHVLSLFKSNSQLKQRLLNSAELDPSIGLRVVDLLKQDGRDYYNIYMYILRQHYKSIVYDHKEWYMVEDKLCFNKNFIEWFAEDLVKVMKGQAQCGSDSLKKIAQETKDIKNIEDLELSILQRNKIIDLQHSRIKNKQFKRIPNPLYENDRFDCAQLIIEEISPQLKEKQSTKYLKFQQFGVSQKDINFIDQIDSKFDYMCSTLLAHLHKPIGFDTEFRCVSTKYQQQGVSLIQLSTHTQHFVIDFLKLQNQKQFNQFIIKILCNQNYIKVGHTVSSDIRYLRLTLRIPQDLSIKNFIDITVMFKSLHPNEKFSSLSFMCLKFLQRKLSKYEQRSNWNRRPLKKTQLHYGALDAFACVLIYDKIKDDYHEIVKFGKVKNLAAETLKALKQQQEATTPLKSQQQKNPQIIKQQHPSKIELIGNSQFVGDTFRSERLIYNKKFESYISSKEPKFLVDNMLKKLSSVMRNCGLDAQYIAVRDYQLATEIAQKDQRIILTRDTKFFQRKDNKIPIYLIKQRTDSDKMFEEVKQFFKLDLSSFQTLSRCVKCNGPELIIISKQEAMNQIKFKYEDSSVEQFWRCTKCRQIYWQGGMFERAKQKYANLKK